MYLNNPKFPDGDFEVNVTSYFGDVNATIELGSGVTLCDVTDDDADRLIRAASAVKEANAAGRERITQPHNYWKVGVRCLTCGKPEDDELHAEPKPLKISDETIAAAKVLADDIAAGTWPPKAEEPKP